MTIASSSPPSRLPLRGVEGAGTEQRTGRAKARENGGDGRLAAVFIAPALLGFTVFRLWPTLRGFDRIPFLADQTWAIPTIALINVWRHVGYTALLLFAGLQAIPNDVYEAAKVDGASEWRMFWRITMPLLRPVLAVVLIMTVIGSFQVFDTVAVTTGGGPANATNVLQYYIYQSAFGRFQFGYASAMSVALLIVLSAITV